MKNNTLPVMQLSDIPQNNFVYHRVKALMEAFADGLYIVAPDPAWLWCKEKWPDVHRLDKSHFVDERGCVWRITSDDYLATPLLINESETRQLDGYGTIKIGAPCSYFPAWPFSAGYLMTARDARAWFLLCQTNPLAAPASRCDLYLDIDKVMSMQERMHEISPVPYYICVETSSACNLKCRMCMYHSDDLKSEPMYVQKGSFLKPQYFDAIIQELADLKTKCPVDIPYVLTSTRGEFFLYPDATGWIKKIRDKGVGICIVSNGMLVDEMVAAKLVDCEVAQITISLDSATERIGKSIRIGYDHHKVENNIRRLAELKQKKNSRWPRLCLSFTDVGANSHEINAYVQKWKDYADVVMIQTEQYFNKDLRARLFRVKHRDIENNRRDICSALINSIAVLADGSIHCCTCSDFKNDTRLGHVSVQTLSECYHSAREKEIMQAQRLKKYDTCPICSCCEFWKCYQVWPGDQNSDWEHSTSNVGGYTLSHASDRKINNPSFLKILAGIAKI